MEEFFTMEEIPLTLGQKIRKVLVGLFLTILVSMLIITLLPAGDMEESLINQLTGRVSTRAGSVGNRDIPMDYFNTARKECYFQYKEIAPNFASNDAILTNCAFQRIRTIYVGKALADAFGFRVTEFAIKKDLSRQARIYHSEFATRAGYDESDTRSVEEIYRDLLREDPLPYRIEAATVQNLFEEFFVSKIFKTPHQLGLEKESQLAKLTLRVLPLTSARLSELAEENLNFSEEELRKEYDKETKSGITPKDESGKPISFEDRKSILIAKLKFDRKNKAVEEKKLELKRLLEDKKTLDALQNYTQSLPYELTNLTIQDLSSKQIGGRVYRISKDPNFLKDMARLGFGKEKVGGPYEDGENYFFVEFRNLSLPEPKKSTMEENNRTITEEESRNYIANIFLEINQSIAKDMPLSRNPRLEGNEFK